MLRVLLVIALLQAAQAPQPDTEIFLGRLLVAPKVVQIGPPENISSSPGYDNQPSFAPDGKFILFSSARKGKQTDIYRYDLATKDVTQLTDTPESEYSPTVTPDGKHFSVVRVEADSTQRLWQFTLEGRDPALVLPNVKQVGYHVWADDHTLALFVLGQPATLQLADTRTGKAEVVARNVGRSLQRVPGRATISFVQREAAAQAGGAASIWICELDPKTRKVTRLVRAVSGATEADCAWAADGSLLMAYGGWLYRWRRGEAVWSRVATMKGVGLNGVSRIAVSPKGDWIAVVTDAKSGLAGR